MGSDLSVPDHCLSFYFGVQDFSVLSNLHTCSLIYM